MTQPDEELLTLEDRLEERLDPDNRDPETSPEDAAEQATPANPLDGPEAGRTASYEVNEYDAAEQNRLVHLDDDYR